MFDFWNLKHVKKRVYLLVEHTVDNEQEGPLLGVEQNEHNLEEEVALVQTQDPGTAQDDKLGQDLEQNQSEKKKYIN